MLSRRLLAAVLGPSNGKTRRKDGPQLSRSCSGFDCTTRVRSTNSSPLKAPVAAAALASRGPLGKFACLVGETTTTLAATLRHKNNTPTDWSLIRNTLECATLRDK